MLIIGHRGARGLKTENTLESVAEAFKFGADGVETDIRVTADGVPILIHDELLRDKLGNGWRVDQHSLEFLRQQVDTMATIDELIEVIPNGKQIRIEIKPGENAKPIIEYLKKIPNNKITNTIVVSFDFSILKKIRAEIPGLSLGVNEKWSSLRAVSRAKRLGVDVIQMNQRWLWRGVLSGFKKQGFKITPYTVNSRRQAQAWANLVDGIITDYPDRFADFIC